MTGRLAYFIGKWHGLTSDKWVLDTVQHYHIETSHTDGEFISNIFLRPKKDESFCPVISLRGLNAFVAYYHFKMETIRYVI